MSQEPEVTLPTAYHDPIEVDAPKDGAWMCSAYGMNSRQPPPKRPRRSFFLPIALMVVLPLLCTLVVWLVRLSLQR